MDVLRRNNVKVRPGAGPALMFAHGFGCDQTMWHEVQALLAPTQPTVLFDLVGAGDSDLSAFDPLKYTDLGGHADDVLEILDALGLEQVVFVGHSVSAMIGVLAVRRQRRPAIGRLVLVGPSPRYINAAGYQGGFERADIEELLDTLDANYLGWSQAMAPVIMGAPDRPELSDRLANSFCRTDPDIARHFARTTFLSDNRDDLAGVGVPTLVLQCRQDAIAPVAVGQFVAAQLPDSRLVILDVVGHCPHLSAPEAVVDAIDGFLGEGQRGAPHRQVA
jgi:sigma-B regulation protein RsbQ